MSTTPTTPDAVDQLVAAQHPVAATKAGEPPAVAFYATEGRAKMPDAVEMMKNASVPPCLFKHLPPAANQLVDEPVRRYPTVEAAAEAMKHAGELLKEEIAKKGS